MLPDLGGPDLTDADKALDHVVDNIDIIDAYNKWCGKMRPEPNGKREGIKISCPDPAHPDKDPSAWINLDKQTWFCGGCQVGGDAHDIAAFAFGLPVPGYKEGETFHKLREDMAEAFGFRTKKVAGSKIAWVEEPSRPAASPSVTEEEEIPEENVLQLIKDADDGTDDLVVYPSINWQRIVPPNTFLFEYMKACTNDDAPEEYHFWHGLMALGLVCGRKVTLDDTPPVYANLLLCILGSTGSGKSRSRRYLVKVLEDAAPFAEDGVSTRGVLQVPVPSSGEYLVGQFSYEGKDPTNNKRSIGYQPVTGIVDFDEMASLIARARRQGSTLQTTIMNFADANETVKIGGLQRGEFIAKEPFCSITASTQPKALRTLLSRVDASSGFINRWVFAGGKKKKTEAIGGSRSGISVDLTVATQLLKEVRGWGGVERSIGWEDDAAEEYTKYFHDKVEPWKVKDQSDMLQRIDLLAKKLMLLMTINIKKDNIPLHVVKAMKPLIDYVIECYGIISDNIGVTVMQEVMLDLQAAISKHSVKKDGQAASIRDIRRQLGRKNYTYEQIDKALKVMTSLDLIELQPAKEGKVGRPTPKWKVVS